MLTTNDKLALTIRLEQLLGEMLPASDLQPGLARLRPVLAQIETREDGDGAEVREATTLLEDRIAALEADLARLSTAADAAAGDASETITQLHADLDRATAQVAALEADLAAATTPAATDTPA